MTFSLALLWLCISAGAAKASPPVDPRLADCPEGEFLHVHSGQCLPLDTTYGFDDFAEPTETIRLASCDVDELREAVSQGNRTIFLRSGCTYELGGQDLDLESNTVIDGMSQFDAEEIRASAALSETETAGGETVITCTGTTAFRVHGVSNIIIRNLTIDGQNNRRNNRGCGTLIFIDEGADNILAERLRLQNGRGKGVGFRTATRVTVRYSWVEDMWDDHGLNADNQFEDIAYYSNYITRVGISRNETGYGINSHASKAEIAGNYIEDTDSGIKLMGARYTLLHHNTIIGSSSSNPLYRGVWTAIDDNDNVRPIAHVYYDNFIDTDGVRPFSILDSATDIYLAGNYYGDVSRHIPVSQGSGVYKCADSSDSHLTGKLITVSSRAVEFPDSGMGTFDPCALQKDASYDWMASLPPIIRAGPRSQQLIVGQQATLKVSALMVPRHATISPAFSLSGASSGTAAVSSSSTLSLTSSLISSSTLSSTEIISSAITYQWQRQIGSGRWFNIRNATEPSFTTGPLRVYNSGNQYRVNLSNAFGDVTSQAAVLTVLPVPEPTDRCVTASSEWQSSPLATQTGRFRATFTATAPSDQSDGLVGLSLGPADEFSDLAVIVRFARSGYIDVRNDQHYMADEALEYSSGQSFRFRLEIDINKHIYSVHIATITDGNVNDDEFELADDYTFRDEQKQIQTLDSWNFWDGVGDLEVCDLQP